jgi:hypothetical protein
MKDELVTLLCPKFYEYAGIVDGSADPIPGQLVSAHTAYPPVEPWIIKVHSYNAVDPSQSRYEVKRFQSGDQSHFPIAELQLRSDENYYVYKGKERPLVVVGMIKSRWANPQYDESIFLCAPMFTFKPKHSDEFKIRCVGFCHPSLFYLPREPNGCPNEGAVRFEYMQPIARRGLRNYFAGTPPQPIKLSDEAFALFVNHLGRFLFRRDFDSEVCAQIDAYHQLIDEELQKTSRN